ncbi:MAG: hypothetical protein FWD73_03525 [Polyangiaceae bacterium]|nr:hypothetical protein [Polyangiaceae bacterium]
MPATPEPPRIPFAALFRMFVIGSVAIAAAAYAIWRHYTVPLAPMLGPAPSATEIPAPELEPVPPSP